MASIPNPPSVETAPAVTPVTLAEAKAQLRVEHTAEDTHITLLIGAATDACESLTGRSLITQTLKWTLDRWPYDARESAVNRHAIVLPKPPVQSVTSVTYTDADGDSQTLVEDTDYVVILGDPFTRIVPAYGKTWPTVRDIAGAIEIAYVAGFGDAASDVPDWLRKGILQAIDSANRNRSDEVTGVSVAEIKEASRIIFGQNAVNVVG